MSWGPLLVNLAVTAGTVAVLMLATFGYAMRARVHAIMDTVWPLGFVIIAAVAWFILSMTNFGFRVFAVGGSAKAARVSGIHVNAVKIWAFILMGALAAFAPPIETLPGTNNYSRPCATKLGKGESSQKCETFH